MKYTKNIEYVPAATALKWVNSGRMNDSIAVLAMAAMYLQGTRGAQMIVAKSVTDELDRTDMLSSVSFADVPWPAKSLEFYFDDSVKMPSSDAVSERDPSDARTALNFSTCVGEMRICGHL